MRNALYKRLMEPPPRLKRVKKSARRRSRVLCTNIGRSSSRDGKTLLNLDYLVDFGFGEHSTPRSLEIGVDLLQSQVG